MLDREALSLRYARVRTRTEALAAPLSPEDAMVQSMPDASPAKWHLAHTTWFFEEFVLARFDRGHRWRDERWRVLFNSYYEAVGPRHARPARGVLSRPSLDAVRAWRAWVDERVLALLPEVEEAALDAVLLGTHHEEQHQELLLTDIQHGLFSSELRAAYTDRPLEALPRPSAALPLTWAAFDESPVELGHAGDGFAFDNETPRHRALVGPFRLASRLVTNGEYGAFVADGGYTRPDLWLADGWAAVQAGGWDAPLYWESGGSTPTSRSRVSAITRPTRTRGGRGRGCPRRPSGSAPPAVSGWRAPSSTTGGSRRRARPARERRSSSATRGNGRPARTCRIPASVPSKVRSASTTASS